MTLEDFTRNQRGLNNKADFPRPFLESIYKAIKSREIVMPEEQAGDLREDYEWKVRVQRIVTYPLLESTLQFTAAAMPYRSHVRVMTIDCICDVPMRYSL